MAKKKRPRGRPQGNPALFVREPGAPVVAEAGVSLTLEEILQDLVDMVADRAYLDELVAQAVPAARAQGATWTALAGALGVSPQAVQKRYGRPRDT